MNRARTAERTQVSKSKNKRSAYTVDTRLPIRVSLNPEPEGAREKGRGGGGDTARNERIAITQHTHLEGPVVGGGVCLVRNLIPRLRDLPWKDLLLSELAAENIDNVAAVGSAVSGAVLRFAPTSRICAFSSNRSQGSRELPHTVSVLGVASIEAARVCSQQLAEQFERILPKKVKGAGHTGCRGWQSLRG